MSTALISKELRSQPLSDEALTAACEFALRPFGDGVRVDVTQGWVRLSGSVTRACDRWRAEERVGRVPGLSGINAQIVVRVAAGPTARSKLEAA